MTTLNDRNALVIGGSSGIGKATVQALVANGARVTAVARGADRLATLAGEVGDGLTIRSGDATDDVFGNTLLSEQMPDLLVMSAGVMPHMARIDAFEWESFPEAWNGDLKATFHLVKQVLTMPLRPGSTMVIVSSGAAVRGSPMSGGYAGAKRRRDRYRHQRHARRSAEMSSLVATAAESRQRFLDLIADVRPELHRYCARMTGSVFDGEDVVLDTLAKAWFALAEMDATPPLRPWLFRIAHNASMDFVRRYEYRNLDADADPEVAAEMMAARDRDAHEPDGDLVESALKVFAALSPVQRSALALKDVLSLSLEETAETMGLSVAAVKGALVRARANVAKARTSGAAARVDDERLRKYALLFNTRDWDGLRAMFGEETRLDVISRYTVRGPGAAAYFTKYAEIMPVEDLRAVAGSVDGVPVIAMFRPADSVRPAYFVRLEWLNDRVHHVRDYRYAAYVGDEADFVN